MERRNFLALSALGLAANTSLLAWPASAQSNKIVLYTTNPEQSVESVADVIKGKIPGATVSSIAGGSAVLLRRLEAEAGNVQGDLFWSSSTNTVGAFEKLFEAYASPELTSVPASLRYPGDLFAPSNVHVVVIMVNKNQLGGRPVPKTWSDLLDPAWKGKIVVADPTNSSTAYTILWGVEKLLGEDALKKLAANVAVSSSSSAVQSGVSMGEYPLGLAFEANAYPYVDGGQKEIELVYPTEGTFTSVEYAGLVKNAPAGARAKAAYDALISKEAQVALLKTAFRRPSRGDIEVSKIVALPELANIKVFPVDEKEAATRRADFLKRWNAYVAGSAR
jgi:iron(III) transport system substrate-binding protein